MTSTVGTPEYDITRAEGCPFDPAPAMRARQREGSVTRVRLWDGSTPWQVAYPALLRRVPGLRLATDLDQISFKHDGFIYGVHELPVTW